MVSAVGRLTLLTSWMYLRHPMFLAGAVLSPLYLRYLVAASLGSAVPVLHRDDGLVVAAVLPLALGTLLAAGTVVLAEERSHALGGLTESVPLDPLARIGARVLALVVPATAAALFTLAGLGWLIARDAVGTPSVAALGNAPLMTTVAGALGIAAAMWIPHPLVPTLVALAVAAVEQAILVTQNNGTLTWLALWPSQASAEAAPELVFRPYARHFVYLFAAWLVLGCLAALRRRGGIVLAAALVSVALVCAAAAWVIAPPTLQARRHASELLASPSAHQRCVDRGIVEACAYRDYAPWAEQWARLAVSIVQPVERRLGRQVVIRQKLALAHVQVQRLLADPRGIASSGTPPAVTVPTLWPRIDQPSDELGGFALQLGAWAVGLKSTSRDETETCSAVGQARAAVAVYLASQAGSAVRASVRRLARYGTLYAGPAGMTLRELTFGFNLARAPGRARMFGSAWSRIRDPSTTVDDLASIVHQEPPARDRRGASIFSSYPVCR